MSMMFYKLAIGSRFSFGGQRYVKTAMSMAQDEQPIGNLFLAETEVTVEGEPLLLSPAEADRWKPSDKHWTEFLGPAPSERPVAAPRASASRTGIFNHETH